jgi:hypothetical protein
MAAQDFSSARERNPRFGYPGPRADMPSTPSQIPITVFTGFLGAGKTSIILSLLPQLPSGYRVVLLKNEFGDIEGSFVGIHPRSPFSCL